MTIGDFIKKRRTELGLTLEEVGNATGVSKSTVKKWETGFISNMRRDRIEQLAKILKVNPVIFIEDEINDYDLAVSKYKNVSKDSISYRILSIMKYRKISLNDLANNLDVNLKNLYDFIFNTSENDMASDPRLYGIAEALGIKSIDFLTGFDVFSDDDSENYINFLMQKIDNNLPLTTEESNTVLDYLNDEVSFNNKAYKIPVLGYVRAGIPIEAVEEIIDYEEISQEQARTGEFFGLQIKGDSMEPRITEGDIVIVRKQETVDNGDIAVVLINGDDATVKKFYKSDAGIKLVSTNPKYDPFFYTPDEVNSLPISIVGKEFT